MKLEIRSIPPRFRRAGLEFTREAQVVDTDALDDEQIDSLHAEPRLIVRDLTGPEAGTGNEPVPEAATGSEPAPTNTTTSESPRTGGDGGSTPPPSRPEGDALTAAIRKAAAQLDPADDAHWTRSGQPDVRALEAVLGFGITAAERNAADVKRPGA